jgi:hypothetical protein
VKVGRYGRKRRYAPEWQLTEFPFGDDKATHDYLLWRGNAPEVSISDHQDRLNAIQQAAV